MVGAAGGMDSDIKGSTRERIGGEPRYAWLMPRTPVRGIQAHPTDRIVGTLVGPLVIAHAIPLEAPEHLEVALTDFCFRIDGVSSGMFWFFEDWLDEPAAEMLVEALDSGFMWSPASPSPVHAFVGATLIGPALTDLGPGGWWALGRPEPWLAGVEGICWEDDDGAEPALIMVAGSAHTDHVFERRTNQFLDFAEAIAAGDWAACPDCGGPWDRDDCECLEGCWRPEAFEWLGDPG